MAGAGVNHTVVCEGSLNAKEREEGFDRRRDRVSASVAPCFGAIARAAGSPDGQCEPRRARGQKAAIARARKLASRRPR